VRVIYMTLALLTLACEPPDDAAEPDSEECVDGQWEPQDTGPEADDDSTIVDEARSARKRTERLLNRVREAHPEGT